MDVNFLFMDECYSETIDDRGTIISSLTGVLVPTQKYAELRIKFYKLLEWSINPKPGSINMNVPELHGRELLPDEGDERKLEMMEGIVSLVTSNNILIYRVGNYITETIKDIYKGDENLMGLCWLRILDRLEPLIEKEMLIPIMDGFDTNMMRTFSQLVKNMDVMRTTDHGMPLSIKHTENILGEVFYGDSRYSIFTQVADIISWLRNLKDVSKEGKQLTYYKERCLKISRKLDTAITHEKISAINLDGVMHAPSRK